MLYVVIVTFSRHFPPLRSTKGSPLVFDVVSEEKGVTFALYGVQRKEIVLPSTVLKESGHCCLMLVSKWVTLAFCSLQREAALPPSEVSLRKGSLLHSRSLEVGHCCPELFSKWATLALCSLRRKAALLPSKVSTARCHFCPL